MAEYVKVELVGSVYSEPKYQSGITKQGKDYELGTVSIRASGQFFNCSAFGTVARFISELEINDVVFVTGLLKQSKGTDEKWYTQFQVDFIARLGNEITATQFVKKKGKAKVAEEDYQEQEQQEQQSPYDFVDDDLPF